VYLVEVVMPTKQKVYGWNIPQKLDVVVLSHVSKSNNHVTTYIFLGGSVRTRIKNPNTLIFFKPFSFRMAISCVAA
jgi:hypothetical protein